MEFNNGIIIQFGYNIFKDSAVNSFTLPIAYSNSHYSIVSTDNTYANNVGHCGIREVNLTTFKIRCATNTRWITIGF